MVMQPGVVCNRLHWDYRASCASILPKTRGLLGKYYMLQTICGQERSKIWAVYGEDQHGWLRWAQHFEMGRWKSLASTLFATCSITPASAWACMVGLC